MKFITVIFTLSIASSLAKAQETIEWVHAHGAASAATAGYVAVVEEANRAQKKFQLINVFKPGGDGKVAIDYVNERVQHRLTSTTGAIADALVTGRIDAAAYKPVQGLWDVCWAAAMSTRPESTKSVMAAASSSGSLAHYIALGLASKYQFELDMVWFKTNAEGFLNMVGNNGVTLAADRIQTILGFQQRNEKIKVVGLHCPIRHPKFGDIPTLIEMGVVLPPASVSVIASQNMEQQRVLELRKIFADALTAVGNDRLWDIGDLRSPVFANISPDTYHNQHLAALLQARQRFARQLAQDK